MLRAAERRYSEAARLAAAAASVAGRAWDEVALSALDSWDPTLLASRVAALQLTAARGAGAYLERVLTEQGISADAEGAVVASSVAGVAGDGRSLVSLLDEPRIQAKTLIGEGMGAQQAWDRARSTLRLMSVTAVQDAGRAADSVAMAARPQVTGYVRMLNLPSCSRCTILAGKFFRWNVGFARHPRCDCRHIPSTEALSSDLRVDPLKAIKSGQVTGLSQADLRAIVEDGASPVSVINAQRGMYTADVFGVRVKATTAAAKDPRVPRLRPETIYRRAGNDRAKALALLRRFGYLT
jgi:hypothetical protein